MEIKSNPTINDLLEQLISDLKKKGEYAKFEQMNERQRRLELLTILHEKVYARKQKVSLIMNLLIAML